jgi:hypothetical protein
MVLDLKRSHFLARSRLKEIRELCSTIQRFSFSNDSAKSWVRLQIWLRSQLMIRRGSIARAGSRSVPTPP